MFYKRINLTIDPILIRRKRKEKKKDNRKSIQITNCFYAKTCSQYSKRHLHHIIYLSNHKNNFYKVRIIWSIFQSHLIFTWRPLCTYYSLSGPCSHIWIPTWACQIRTSCSSGQAQAWDIDWQGFERRKIKTTWWLRQWEFHKRGTLYMGEGTRRRRKSLNQKKIINKDNLIIQIL